MNKISVRRWRRRSPLQRGRFPRIIIHLLATLDAPEEINDERDLGETHDPRRPRDGVIPLKAGQSPNGVFVRNSPSLATVVPTAMHPGHSLQKHRKKNHVHAD